MVDAGDIWEREERSDRGSSVRKGKQGKNDITMRRNNDFVECILF